MLNAFISQSMQGLFGSRGPDVCSSLKGEEGTFTYTFEANTPKFGSEHA